jgi:hypothetical protein
VEDDNDRKTGDMEDDEDEEDKPQMGPSSPRFRDTDPAVSSQSAKSIWNQLVRLYLLVDGKQIQFKFENAKTQQLISLYASQRRIQFASNFDRLQKLVQQEDSSLFQKESVFEFADYPDCHWINADFSENEGTWIFSPFNQFTPQQFFRSFDEDNNQGRHNLVKQHVSLLEPTSCVCASFDRCHCQPTRLHVHLKLVEIDRNLFPNSLNNHVTPCSYPFRNSFVEVSTPKSVPSLFRAFRIAIPEVNIGEKTFETIKVPYMPQLAFEKYLFALNVLFTKEWPSSVTECEISFEDVGVASLFHHYHAMVIPPLELSHSTHKAFLENFSASAWCDEFEKADAELWGHHSPIRESLFKQFSAFKTSFFWHQNENKAGKDTSILKLAAKNFHINFIRTLCAIGSKQIRFTERKLVPTDVHPQTQV